ncbi:hypothetical protein DL765_003667 [Monosporascus sp. GIB2]|nr:hypothetical protein DL765_003667 [Monosporascus sp. GIB2]
MWRTKPAESNATDTYLGLGFWMTRREPHRISTFISEGRRGEPCSTNEGSVVVSSEPPAYASAAAGCLCADDAVLALDCGDRVGFASSVR